MQIKSKKGMKTWTEKCYLKHGLMRRLESLFWSIGLQSQLAQISHKMNNSQQFTVKIKRKILNKIII